MLVMKAAMSMFLVEASGRRAPQLLNKTPLGSCDHVHGWYETRPKENRDSDVPALRHVSSVTSALHWSVCARKGSLHVSRYGSSMVLQEVTRWPGYATCMTMTNRKADVVALVASYMIVLMLILPEFPLTEYAEHAGNTKRNKM